MNYLLLRTPLGRKYTVRIAEHLRRLGHRALVYKCGSIDLFFREHKNFNPDNLIIHVRAADPNSFWMQRLVELQDQGYRVINKPEVLKLTSDKYACNKFLIDSGDNTIPKTFLREKGKRISDRNIESIKTEEVVIKPRYSQGGGVHVRKINKEQLSDTNFLDELTKNYSCSSIIQELVPYTGIYRVFVIDKIAIPVLTYDRPYNNWKVSVCLNQRQIPILSDYFNDEHQVIINYAERIQNLISGEINFIDVFTTENGPVLSEINTACSLLTHERITNYPISYNIASYLHSLH